MRGGKNPPAGKGNRKNHSEEIKKKKRPRTPASGMLRTPAPIGSLAFLENKKAADKPPHRRSSALLPAKYCTKITMGESRVFWTSQPRLAVPPELGLPCGSSVCFLFSEATS